MSTKTKKILTFVATLLLVIALGASTVLGTTLKPGELKGTTPTSQDDIKDLGNKIIGVLQTVGVVLAVVILIILGIKYMMGSAEEKADYKKTMIPYIIGAACIFLAPQIAGVVLSFLQD